MKRSILMAMLGLFVTGQLAFAQQANQNINVLPLPADPLAPDAHLLGDLYLQRQVEPTIVASTRNPDHLMAFFVDYRAVDIADDPGMGELQSVAQFFLTSVKNLFWRLFRPSKRGVLELPIQAALDPVAEAWVGCSRSYDGGLTWSGCYVPGGPFDGSLASEISPAHGLEAATDPVAWAAPCGYIHVAFIAFTRGGSSKMLVATYQDQNDVEGGDTWHYKYTTEIEVGNNAEHGLFIDKPFLIVDVDREDSGDACAHNIYCSYSTFNGQDKNGNFRSKITFAKSTDLGLSWDTDKLNPPYHQNQGTWMAIDPLDGEIYLFWRHFIDPEAILMMRSTNYGRTFPGQPRIITGDLDLATFDQLGIGTTTPGITDPVTDISFRSNGFPTAAVGVDSVTQQRSVLVAWQERVDTVPESPSFGQPCEWDFDLSPECSPRIMLLHSLDGGNTWSDAGDPLDPGYPQDERHPPETRRAVDLGDRDCIDPGCPPPPPPGFGALPQPRPSGPQVQPTLSCGGGR